MNFSLSKHLTGKSKITLLTLLKLAAFTPTLLMAHTTPPIQSKGDVPLKLYVFDCGTIEARDLSLFNPLIKKGTQKTLASPCYLIQHAKGNLLWDTGLADELIHNKDGIEVMEGAFKMSVTKTLASQLAEINVKPSEIDYLTFSHLHNDHTGNAKYFTNAKWLMQKPEHIAAYHQDAQKYGYHPHDYKPLKGVKITDLSGQHDLFGDGSVIIVPTPGHSAGHQSLFVDLPNTGPVVLSGDLYHFQENREQYGIPVWNNKKETIHSFTRIDKLLDSTKATLWIHHDKAQFDSLKHSPSYYD